MGRRHQEQRRSRGVEALLPLSDAVGGVNTGRQADPRVPGALVARGTRTTCPSGAGVLIPCLRRACCWVPNSAPAAGRPPNSDPTGTQQRHPTGTQLAAVGSARTDRPGPCPVSVRGRSLNQLADRRLSIPIPPAFCEVIDSYLDRLAEVSHLRPDALRSYLTNVRATPTYRRMLAVDRLGS